MSSPGRVFIAEDDPLILLNLTRVLKRQGYEVQSTPTARGLVDKVFAWLPEVVLLDIGLQDGSGLDVLRELRDRGVDTEVVMLTGDATAQTATRALKAGASDYLTKPFDLNEVRKVIGNLAEKQRLKRELEQRRSAEGEPDVPELVGRSPGMAELREKVEKIAAAGVDTILVTGESGTGKEVVARHVHHRMRRDAPDYAPFIGVNCTALTESLIESELFGHERGAFTDAKTMKKGVFELAGRGTILLDEIGDMPFAFQGKLLRVLQERTIRRIAGKEDIPIHATVIASTNRDLREAADRGAFRLDLLYRLDAFSLVVPPLRDRGGDVLAFTEHFLVSLSAKYKRPRVQALSPGCRAALLAYPWPGNVRELKNVLERLVVLEASDTIGVEHLPKELVGSGPPGAPPDPEPQPPLPVSRLVLPDGGLSLEEVRRDLIVQALEKAKHNKRKAAKLLRISYDTLRYQMKRFDLE
ncbi:MAG: sigma-54-dependent transcriptional regulator [Deferrisomatales bacterium]